MLIDFATPGLLEEKPQNPKELNIFKKMVQHSPEAFPNYQQKTPAPLVQPVSLFFWFLLFGIFATLRTFAFQQATQLNMQEPKKPTVQTEET